MYNLMSGGGFAGGAYSSAWIASWLVIGVFGIVCFLGYKMKEADQIPFPFSFAGSLAGPLLAILTITFTGSYKIAFILGLVGLMGGAYFLGKQEEGG